LADILERGERCIRLLKKPGLAGWYRDHMAQLGESRSAGGEESSSESQGED
jgi:hypothetical protein